jgi:16S rRNA (cytosine1402-N4)-methyltransferase
MTAALHVSVMLTEVVDALSPRDGEVMIDGTFGVGGYSRALLAAAGCRVIGVDRDPDAIARGRLLADAFNGRLTMAHGCFGEMDRLAAEAGAETVDGVTLDLGVSSPQLDEAERGFSFRFDGPLDMRMGREGVSAADVVNETPEEQLADIIYELGEERLSRRVARAIVHARRAASITRTLELAEVVRRVVPKSRDGVDPATRTFQALRMHVNDELGEIRRGLAAAERILAPGGRLAVVTFHSLEDRAVKNFLKSRSEPPAAPSRHAPMNVEAARPPSFRLLHRKPLSPSAEETARNPRARSARLRAAVRTAAAAFPNIAGASRGAS